jgi:hypothetical protein
MSIVVTQCSKNDSDEKRSEEKPDVRLEDYLEDAPMVWGTKVKHAWEDIIPKEGYDPLDLPFLNGWVKGYSVSFPCKKHPEIFWEKKTKESTCKVTAYFDCEANYLSHDSSCIIHED